MSCREVELEIWAKWVGFGLKLGLDPKEENENGNHNKYLLHWGKWKCKKVC